jgi:monovalent cation/hydrogen antiporter
MEFLEEKFAAGNDGNELLSNLHARLKIDATHFVSMLEETNHLPAKSIGNFQRIHLEILEHQRSLLQSMNLHAEFNEELIRKYLSLIDLEEYKIRESILE